MLIANETHPFPIVRVKELLGWADSTAYRDIMAGRYPRGLPSDEYGQQSVICSECHRNIPAHVMFCLDCGASVRRAAAGI